jgi:hypothetical protein
MAENTRDDELRLRMTNAHTTQDARYKVKMGGARQEVKPEVKSGGCQVY